MTAPPNPDTTDRIISQGRALVRAIDGTGEITPTGWVERFLVTLLLASYRQRLRAVVEAAPAWMTDEILSASRRISDDRSALWMSEN